MNHRTEELMALECSHVFHVTCINECWTKLGRPQWCPYKCTENISNVDDDNDIEMGTVSLLTESAVGPSDSEGPPPATFNIIM